MSVDRSYRIRIETVGDTSGAKQVAGAVKDLTDATERSSAANEEHHHSFVHAGNGAKEFHKILHQITEQSPALGLALKAALSPTGALLTAGLIAFRSLEEEIKRNEEAFRDFAKEASQPMGNMKESITQAGELLAQQQQDFEHWQQSLLRGTDAIINSLDLEIEKIKQQAEATKELLKAQADLEKARIDEKVGAGLSEPEAEYQKAQIDARLRRAEAKTEQEALAAEIDAKSKAANQEAERERNAQLELERLNKIANDKAGAAKMANLPKEIQSEEDKATKLREALKNAEAETAKAEERVQAQHAAGYDTSKDSRLREEYRISEQELAAANEKEAEVRQNLHNSEMFIERAKKHLGELERAHTGLDKRVEDAKKTAEDAAHAFERLNQEVQKLRTQQAATGAGSPVANAKEAAEREAQRALLLKTGFGTTAQGDVMSAIATATAIGQHQSVSASASSQLVDVASKIAGHQVNLQQAVGMMQWAAKSMDNFVTDTLRLADAMVGLSVHSSTLDGRVSFVEQQVKTLLQKTGGLQVTNRINPGGG